MDLYGLYGKEKAIKGIRLWLGDGYSVPVEL